MNFFFVAKITPFWNVCSSSAYRYTSSPRPITTLPAYCLPRP